MSDIRHVLSLSGGKDSAALAVYMRDRVPQMEYIFHDTGKELPETYDYIDRLEAILGQAIHRTTVQDSFDKWLKVFGGMIPSNHRRWCTKMLKLKPFEDFIGNEPVLNYVGLRADEKRIGYISHKENITPVYPFREAGLVRADIVEILESSGLGLPKYMEWGRTRSGCYFCFYQQPIEWVRLWETHNDLFQLAREYEEQSVIHGEEFFWMDTRPLRELEREERRQEIRDAWERANAMRRTTPKRRTLVQILGGVDESEDEREGCLICSL
jgi:3'-phosphoadenosine 5'-phosphosulfate sulfotransferase (PAPS reductase)/FAD synthetase